MLQEAVFANAADPVGDRFVVSLARLEGNLTGITNFEFAMGSTLSFGSPFSQTVFSL